MHPDQTGAGEDPPDPEKEAAGKGANPNRHAGQETNGTVSSSSPASSNSPYQASPIKRKRRTSAQVNSLFDSAVGILNQYDEPVTIRHLFYRLASIRVIEKSEKDYDRLVSHLGKWRINGSIPFSKFVDGTRWHYGVDTFDDAAEAIEDSIRGYRKNLWKSQDYYIEIWCEKEAIASLVRPVADQWGLKTFVCRGFNSLSGSASAAEQFKRAYQRGKKPVILYLGDHDPSGLCIDQSLMKHLSYFTIIPENEFGIPVVKVADRVEFVRVAILPWQIEEFRLPTRPVKETDTRAKGWMGGCVEIDTLSGKQIRELLEDEIDNYVDRGAWDRTQAIEKAERETMTNLMPRIRLELEEAAT